MGVIKQMFAKFMMCLEMAMAKLKHALKVFSNSVQKFNCHVDCHEAGIHFGDPSEIW